LSQKSKSNVRKNGKHIMLWMKLNRPSPALRSKFVFIRDISVAYIV
jgi:hypothetical protein